MLTFMSSALSEGMTPIVSIQSGLCTDGRSIMQSEEKPSLYDRLGGVYSIATVVDDFINHRPQVECQSPSGRSAPSRVA
jgi:hypothetical protein